MLPTPNTNLHTRTTTDVASTVTDSVVSPLRASAFWATVILPILALVLVATSVVSISLLSTAGFLATYGVCAIIGHNHTPH
ncbi:hypothetical protein ACLI4Z_03120 [Natrialbaceae archaeon A-arb3/5]